MICYFRESFKPSIKVKIEQQDWESKNLEEIVQRAVNAEAKAGLRPSTIVWDLDIHYPRGHRPSNSTASKVQTQKTTTKDSFRPKKPKAKDIIAVHANASEPLEQDKKDKKDRLDKKQNFRERREPNETPTTGDNVINASKKDLRKKRDTNKLIYFNYNKKSNYTSNCIKLAKN